ncbi:MAG: GHKL domain-containing protein [Gemmatimonadaceae bacterium]|nr:GHKL domain-containing protein [Gemmatimonadaceae bacterium]
MTSEDVMARLAEHRALGGAPVAEHAWLCDHGTVRRLALGQIVTAKGAQATELMVVFEGHMVIRADSGAGAHKVFEWRGGDVSGVMPYSRGASPPSNTVCEAPTVMLTIARELLPEMIRECPSVTTVLVHAMVDRARQFTTNSLRDEKLVSLGKLAAGLAHELNNPASAVVRDAKQMTESIEVSEAAARRLGAAGLSGEQLARVDAIRELCLKAAPTMMRSTIGRSDREDELVEWLDEHDADERCAGPLAETAVTIESLDELAALVDGEVLSDTLKWLAAGCNTRMLSCDIEAAAQRINDLVGAVKGFTFMDQARLADAVDVRKGIMETVVMLGAKQRAKSAQVSVTIADDLRPAHAVGAELNQVWMNLIDNALDAIDVNGRVEISATNEMARVVVRIVDNGPGIPPSIKGQIFDPFFTTKPAGGGTGLGLDIVRRLLKQQDGEISVESDAGRTEFQVRLPAEP